VAFLLEALIQVSFERPLHVDAQRGFFTWREFHVEAASDESLCTKFDATLARVNRYGLLDPSLDDTLVFRVDEDLGRRRLNIKPKVRFLGGLSIGNPLHSGTTGDYATEKAGANSQHQQSMDHCGARQVKHRSSVKIARLVMQFVMQLAMQQ
jgi:hypothetical protein